MTDRDILRDRIAELIDPNAWKMHRMPEMPGWPESAELIEPSREKAQAIIYELGLTVETQGGFDLVNYRDQIVRTEERSRHVTPWTHVADAAQVGERRNGKDVWFEGWEKQ